MDLRALNEDREWAGVLAGPNWGVPSTTENSKVETDPLNRDHVGGIRQAAAARDHHNHVSLFEQARF